MECNEVIEIVDIFPRTGRRSKKGDFFPQTVKMTEYAILITLYLYPCIYGNTGGRVQSGRTKE